MRVLHLCPLWHPVGIDAIGGIETLLAALIPALTEEGVTSAIVATADSTASATIIPASECGLVNLMARGAAAEYEFHEQHLLALAIRESASYDLVHSHIGSAALCLSELEGMRGRVLHTIHSPVGPDLCSFVTHHTDYWYSTVSEFQSRRVQAAGASHCRAIHNGIDMAAFPVGHDPGDALVFLGRMEPVKGPDVAIRVAKAIGKQLVLAGPVVDEKYFEERVASRLDSEITYAGVVGHDGKSDLLRKSACALLPFSGDEPFGMVALEAMASGTPVASFASGALPEIVDDGVTGYLAPRDDEDALASCASNACALPRDVVRRRAVERFDVSRTAAGYAEIYSSMLDASRAAAS